MAARNAMSARLDHITIIAPSLDIGASFVFRALGVSTETGRAHPGMGTHNRLLSLGTDTYLEVIAVDPAAPPPARPRWFGLDSLTNASAPRLAAWVAGTNNIAAAAVPELGVVETMYRESVSWQMTLTADGSTPLLGAAPALMQRRAGVHPASRLQDVGCRLRRLVIRHPSAETVRSLLARIKLEQPPRVEVQQGDVCHLVAEIDTPNGTRAVG
jgi:hypothetical protein